MNLGLKGSKNNSKRTIVLAIILLGLLVLAYKVLFLSSGDDTVVSENIAASERVNAALRQVESISFDTSVLDEQNFKTLKSIETPLMNLPVGRVNPFAARSN